MKTIAIRCGLAAAFLSAAFAARACDLCAVYTAGMAHGETSGWYAGLFVQVTRYDELRDEGHVIHDDSGQYLDSSITQLFVGYGATDRLSLQLNIPYIDRRFRRPADGGIEHGTVSGLGDVTALAQYTLLRHDDEDETWVWRALGGIKFGTGDSDRLTEELDEGGDAAVPKHGGHDDGAISAPFSPWSSPSFAQRTASITMPAELGESHTSSFISRLSGTSPNVVPSIRMWHHLRSLSHGM